MTNCHFSLPKSFCLCIISLAAMLTCCGMAEMEVLCCCWMKRVLEGCDTVTVRDTVMKLLSWLVNLSDTVHLFLIYW